MINVIKAMVLLVLFLPLLYDALKQKKALYFLFVSLYPILPTTFAIQVSSKLPLISVGRFLLLINILWLLYKDNWAFKVSTPIFLRIFWICEFILSFIHLFSNSSEFNRIFVLIFEEIGFYYVIYKNNSTIYDIICSLEYLIKGFFISCIVGLVQTIANFDLSSALRIAERGEIGVGLNLRMGLTRAGGLINSPILFGAQCAFFVLTSIYLYGQTKKRQLIIFLLIDVLALFCSMSRSSIIIFGIVILLLLLTKFRYFIAKFWPYFLLIPVSLFLVFAFNPSFLEKIIEPIKSIYLMLGGNVSISSQFGDNYTDPANSRNMQWSLLKYMYSDGSLMLGYGYNAYERGMLHFYYRGYSAWDVAQALDVGFVSLIGEYGIIGFIVNISFYVLIFYSSFKKRTKRGNKLSLHDLICYITVFWFLSNIMTAFLGQSVLMIVVYLYLSNLKIKKKYYECKTRFINSSGHIQS